MEEVSKEHKQEIIEKLEKAASPEYVTSWDDKGIPTSKKVSEIEKGKKSRKSGGDFELRVRKDLEEKGWIVSKWQNNVDLETKKVVPAKKGMVFNPFFKRMMPSISSTGFPDFIAFQLLSEGTYNIIGVECKTNGILSKEEKEKCTFLINRKVFNDIWIASKGEDKKIIYTSFKERFPKFI